MKKNEKNNSFKVLVNFILCILLILILFSVIKMMASTKLLKIGMVKNSEKETLLSPSTGVSRYFLMDNLREHWQDMWEPQEKNVCWAYASCKAMEASIYNNSGMVTNLDERPLINAVESWKSSKGITVAGGSSVWAWNHYLRYGNGPKSEDSTYPVGSINVKSVNKIDADINKVKDNIIEYGGVTASISWTGAGQNYHGTYNGYNVMATTFNTPITHAICLLGWDDNFSKDNFPSSWGVTQNGAFWAYNPAGGHELWVSYQDTNVIKDCYYFDTKIEQNQWSTSNPGQRLGDAYWDPDDPEYAAYHGGREIDRSSIQYTFNGVTFNQDYTNVRWTYTGDVIHPTVTTIKNKNGTQLFEGTDFQVYYYHSGYTDADIDNKNAGHRGIIHVWGLNQYDGQSIIQLFAIDPIQLNSDNTEITIGRTSIL